MIHKQRILVLYVYMVLIILLLTHISFLVSASDTLFESNTATTDSNGNFFNTRWLGMTFTVGNTGANVPFILTSIIFKVFRTGTPNDCVAHLRATSLGLPTGSDLGTKTLSGNSWTTLTTGQDVEWIFNSTIVLQPSTMYAIFLSGVSDSSNCGNIRRDSTPSYSGGRCVRSTDSGSTWVNISGETDCYFKVYGILDDYNISYTNLNPLNNSNFYYEVDYDIISNQLEGTPQNYVNLSFNKSCLQGLNTTTKVYFNGTLINTSKWINGSRTFNSLDSDFILYDGNTYTWSINSSYTPLLNYNMSYDFTFNINVTNIPVTECDSTDLTVYNNTINVSGYYDTYYDEDTGNFIWLNFTGIGGGNTTGYTEEELIVYVSSGILLSLAIGLIIIRRKKK